MATNEMVRESLNIIHRLHEEVTTSKRAKWNVHDSGMVLLGPDSLLAQATATLSEVAGVRLDQTESQDLVVGLEKLLAAISELCVDYTHEDSRLTTLYRGHNTSDSDVAVARSDAFRMLDDLEFVARTLQAHFVAASATGHSSIELLWPDLCQRRPNRSDEERRQICDTLFGNEPKSKCTTKLPVLLVRHSLHSETGLVSELTVCERGEGIGLYPELGAMGLTTLSEGGECGFKDSINRVWRAAALADKGRRYSWRITRHPNEKEPLTLQRLHERSCEAAMLCALWHAAGGIPGGVPLDDVLLDSGATVTALIGEAPGEKTSGIPLRAVAGLEAKAISAQKARLRLIIVAAKADNPNQQTEWEEEIDRSRDAAAGIEILPVNTIGEAFEELISISQVRRIYHTAVEQVWRKLFDRDLVSRKVPLHSGE